jgi:hypothetical protein
LDLGFGEATSEANGDIPTRSWNEPATAGEGSRDVGRKPKGQ